MKQFLFVLAFMLTGTALANGAVWTYRDCVEYARSHNISLQKLRLTEKTSGYNLEEAKAGWQPTLDFSTSHGFSNYPLRTGDKNAYNSSYGLNAGWTVWNGGERENTIKRGKLQVERSRIDIEDEMRSIETELLQVYMNILYAEESIAIYEEAVKLSEAQAERAKQLMESGRLSRVDYAQLQSQCEQDRYSLVNARGTYNTRRMELKKILELGIEDSIELRNVEWPSELILAELPPISESYSMAIETDLKIRNLELGKDEASLDEAIAKAGKMPKISLNAGVGTGYTAPGGSFGSGLKQAWNETVGLTFSIPILDNKRTKTAVANARMQQLNAQLDVDLRRTELAQSVENWYIDTRSAQSRYSAAVEQLKSVELTSELTDEQFALGLVNPVELMTAHNNLVEARHSLLQAKYMAMLGKKMIEFYRTASITVD